MDNYVKIAVPVITWKISNYIAAFRSVGAELVQADYTSVPEHYDGLLIPGGVDVSPEYYSQKNTACADIDEELDRLQFFIADQFVAAGKPVLGICRGHQLLNILFGGTLTQHIPNAESHMAISGNDRLHPVYCKEGSRLCKLYGKSFCANSSHHQAIAAAGKEITVTALAEDGTPEAFEHNQLPVWGVQFHPERMCGDFANEKIADGLAVINDFIKTIRGE